MEEYAYGHRGADCVACNCHVPTLAASDEVGSLVFEYGCVGALGAVLLDGHL